MEAHSLADEKQTFKCLCSEVDNYCELFSIENKTIRQCNRCGQVSVGGIDQLNVEAEYDDSAYFIERNCYQEKDAALAKQFQSILDKVTYYKTGGNFLDVGCSLGAFLDIARQSGFDVKGVEISKWASDFAKLKGFDVVTGGLAEAKYRDKYFDVIVVNHVLEHIPEPGKILGEIKRILKNDGLLVIGVPNFGSYMAHLMKGKWFSLMPDQHIWQFTHESLGNLLKKSGFTEVYFEARDNHKIVGWRPVKVLQRLVNRVAIMANNAEAMLVFARKTVDE
jgi:2-polyprenyl-3-methyl-5-hydroxy-6-metoxy-1,4-benzoquinol methylase